MVSLPLPGYAVASTKSTSPPTGVQARPVATPASRVRRLASLRNRGRPSSSRTRASEIDAFFGRAPFEDSATCRATLRQTVPISRSRLRTPASRV
jgi:hypothetical protein